MIRRGVVVAAMVASTVALVPAARAPLGAQAIRGTARSGLDARPLGGVLLELRDTTARTVASTVSAATGGYVLRVPSAGTYTVAARRLGFRSRLLGPFSVRGDTTIDIEMTGIPQLLPTVSAVEQSTCRVHADEASATAMLWESAQTALRSSAVTMREGGYVFDFASSQREYTLEPTTLQQVSVVFSRVRDVKPWVALPVEDLARLGFVYLTKARQLMFAAPDVDMLTSDTFAARHCYTVRDGGRGERLIGLEFRPQPGTRIADVQGTLWLTRDSLRLERLEFAFTGIHFTGHDSLAGGRIEFTQLPDGTWVPTAWVIRSPVPPEQFVQSVVARNRRALERGEDVPILPRDPRWESRRVLVTGGDLVAMTLPDSTVVWRRPPGGLEVTVHWRRGERGPASGVPVVLRGLGATAITDSAGAASFANVPPGDYILDTTMELQDLLRLPREVRTVRVRSATVTRARLTAFPPVNAINTVCAFNGDRAVIAGTVTRDDKEQAWARVIVARASRDERGRERLSTVRTAWSGPGGRFHLCRIPRGESYVVLARFEDGHVERRSVSVPPTTPGQPIIRHVRIDFSAPPPPASVVVSGSAAAASERQH